MKKKFLVGSLLPVLAGAAVVGSGFSLWFFNDTATTNKSQDLSKNVTQLVAIGTIETADEVTITFDQKTRTTSLTKLPAAEGITVNPGTNSKAKYTSPTGDNGVDIFDNDNKTSVEFVTEIKVTKELADYIVLSYDSTAVEYADGAYTIKQVFDFGTNADDMVFDWKKVKIDYATGKEPANKVAYTTFKGIVDSATITVTYTATGVDAK